MPKKIKLVVLIACSISIFGTPFLFRIKQINCSVGKDTCPEGITTALQQLQGRSLFFTPFEKILAEDPALLGYQLEAIQKKLPGTTHFQLQRLPTAFSIQFQEDPKQYRLFSNGQLIPLEKKVDQDALLILMQPPHQVAATQQPALPPELAQNIVTFFAHWNRSQLQNKSVQFKLYPNQTVAVALPDGQVGILSLSESATNIARLQLILEALDLAKIDLSIKEIDVRYRLPVLRTKQTFSYIPSYPPLYQLLLDRTPSSLLC